MSGISLREFGLVTLSGNAFNTTKIVNSSFETALTSGTNWWYSISGTGNASFESGINTTYVSDGSSGLVIQMHAGSTATSGAFVQLSQKMTLSGIDMLSVDYWGLQVDNAFQAEYLFGGSTLGSSFIASGAGLGSGTAQFNMRGYGTGSADFAIRFSCISGGALTNGSHFFVFDRVRAYKGRGFYTADNIKAIDFDGGTELQVEVKLEVF